MAVEKRGIGVEVTGVPDCISPDRMVDKLLIHFLRPRNGGGEVQRVLYPCSCLPGQALVIFQEPEVAARVLKQRPHMLEVGNQQFPLRVKPADRPEVDLPMEATLNVSRIADKAALRRLLAEHGLEVTAQRDQEPLFYVKGSMMMLRAFKLQVEKVLIAQTVDQNHTPFSTALQNHTLFSTALRSHTPSPGAPSSDSTHGSPMKSNRRPSESRGSPDDGSRSPIAQSPPSGPGDLCGHPVYGRSPSQAPRPSSPRPESFIVASEVLDYARRYRTKDIADLLAGYHAEMEVAVADTDPDLSSVLVSGRGARAAAEELKRLLNDLTEMLGIQKISLAVLDHDSQVALAKRIQMFTGVYKRVFIRQVGDNVHLIGPSAECSDLKQTLLASPPQSPTPGRTGRTWGQGSRRRSSSLPRNVSGAKRQGEDAAAAAAPAHREDRSSGQADGGEQGAALKQELKGQRGRSDSLSRKSAKAEEAARGETDGKGPTFKHSLLPPNIQQLFQKNTKKH